ncbi:hypothetical protein P4U24_03745 [Aeribacillus composti]|uniref:hypothetical protein n=1 Tax=Aeribacillus sp. FSL K6-2833 TaxID=2954611 RepID=UPI001022FD3B|nr:MULTISPECIES: hypothetical protein [Aeribacillus]MED1440952.1 hypothetical protein [Aeribacillus composti]RZI52032.1 hypothetical protein EW027_06630 [Aeribacillus pallidus]BBU37909.1 hypothetical protein APP_02010 [Aeribacillus pallidus]
MSTDFTLITGIASIVIWSLLSIELMKSRKDSNGNKSKGRVVILLSAGSLSTLLLTISFFQSI